MELPCKVWTGHTDKFGYGRRRIKGKDWRVHVLEWHNHFGPPPPDKPFVLHTCDVPGCYEITHLWVGTSADNAADMIAKGRGANQKKTHCKYGHEFTPENTYVNPSGVRQCRTCNRSRGRRYDALPERKSRPRRGQGRQTNQESPCTPFSPSTPTWC